MELDTKSPVVEREENLVGTATSASEGALSHDEIERRPRSRPGDLAEYVPGVAATQHSGSGKANQYFLRGFNLDHGTDFAHLVDGMPVNLRTHGHGQGYADLNFLIPELVDGLDLPQGAVLRGCRRFLRRRVRWTIVFVDAMPTGFAAIRSSESDQYARIVGRGDSPRDRRGDAHLRRRSAAHYDGPWRDIDEDVHKRNAFLRFIAPRRKRTTGRLTAMGYDNALELAGPDSATRGGRRFDRSPRLPRHDARRRLDRAIRFPVGWNGGAFGGTFDPRHGRTRSATTSRCGPELHLFPR